MTITVTEEFKDSFWDTNFDELDASEQSDFIISRLYVKGGTRGIAWVNAVYTDEQIIHAAKHRRDLNPIVANYLRKKYNLQKMDMVYYRMMQAGGDKIWPY